MHSYFTGSWRPDEEELKHSGILVTRFVRKPGEMVFVGIGCLHLVRAEGPTANVAWHIGLATPRQFDAAVLRYRLNAARKIKAIVPMQTLAWRLATDLAKNNLVLLQLCAQKVRTLSRKSAVLPICALSDIVRLLTA